MYELSVCNVLVVARSDEPKRIISDSAAPLGFTALHIKFQLIVYLSGCNFTILVHSQRSHSVVFCHKKKLFFDKNL